MIRRIACALLAMSLTFAAVPAPVFAQEIGEKVQQLSQEGAKAYRAGDYAAAARKFEAAYELEAVPNLLFNAAKCYEKLEDWDQAISLYKKFSVAPDVSEDARDRALAQVEKLKEVQALEKKAVDTGEEKQVAEEDKKEEKKPVEPPPEKDYTWTYVALGTGVALLATGGVFGVLASAEQSNFDVAETPEERRAARDSGKTFALTADVMYGLGAAAVIVGVVAAFAGNESKSDGMTLSPVVGPDGAGVTMMGRF